MTLFIMGWLIGHSKLSKIASATLEGSLFYKININEYFQAFLKKEATTGDPDSTHLSQSRIAFDSGLKISKAQALLTSVIRVLLAFRFVNLCTICCSGSGDRRVAAAAVSACPGGTVGYRDDVPAALSAGSGDGAGPVGAPTVRGRPGPAAGQLAGVGGPAGRRPGAAGVFPAGR